MLAAVRDSLEQLTVYNRYATTTATNPIFPGFSGYQNVLKEIINGLNHYHMIEVMILFVSSRVSRCNLERIVKAELYARCWRKTPAQVKGEAP